ncbi:FAD-dependent oxidoreductase [Sinimarinibacterium flocculans]|uniref:Pyruvate/2-oxoglutarate dehydrogenase complex dihydrolipoamide dehydrogenase (E3) component n=1 Tax=Sinimarinibacterium flocculans TaxID=985250 RepID=A0A318ED18_9GAMM|nr:FAD-dependent oxidoreductase [Sinimarinibacterium flocculans]PXV69504.1 pyruvate/2-oxoglutarate dehydrogenase complex dihydrolipoamide dehydrogenase (E3) component [Sinimarinibacterium flocculans]
MKPARLLVLAAVAALVAAWFAFDLGRYLSLDALKAQREVILAWRDAQPLTASLAFVAIYVAVTALSLPGAAILTLAAGAIFGLGWGLVLASFASSIGATLAMLVARFVAGEAVQRRYAERLRAINAGIERDGAFYLFTLRLVPLFPFFVINLLMGLTRIRVWTFYWISQIGMLAGTAVYVNAGTQLAQLESVGGILSPGLLGAFVLLGLFPLIARRLVDLVRARRVYAPYRRPRHFDRNLIVIGAGSAGLVSALIAATVRARVTLIERHRMGGDCLNTGCVPSKALIRSAKLAAQMRRAEEFGLAPVDARPVFAQVMERVQEVVRAIEPHDSIERYTGLGVECIKGRARLVDPWTVDVDGRRLTARDIVIATGAEPLVPPIPGLREAGYRTSEDLWDLRELPARLVVLGGGPIGCELAQAFARLGSKVTQVEMLPRLMMREDPEISATVQARFAAEGIDVRVGTRATSVVIENGQKWLVCEADDGPLRVGFDEILVAVGRVSRLGGYGLEELGVRTGRTLEVNEYLQTSFPNIWACGDVAGPYQFTHTASHMAWYAAVNSLFGPLLALRGGRFRVDYRVIPWATFTEPEVARVGLNETEAREKGIAHEVTTYGLDDLDRAIADGEAHGMVKVLTVPEKDRILGVTIVGEHAGELIAEYVLAMRHGIGLNKILGTIHIYPTLAEANKYAAGRWKQAHKPERLLRWVERWHRWRRG